MRLERAGRLHRPQRARALAGAGGGAPYVIGEVWTQRIASTHPTAGVREIGQIAEASDGRLVAGSYDRTFVSTDGGETFTEYTVTGMKGQIVYGSTPNRFVCISYSPNTLRYSSDGINWTTSGAPTITFDGLAWVPFLSKFVAIRRSTSFPVAYWSTDGNTWTDLETAASGVNIEDIFVAPDHILACFGTTNRRRSNVATPLDAAWTATTGIAFKILAVWAGSYGWRVVRRASATQLLYSSADGTTFTSLGSVLPSSAVWRGIAFDPDAERLFLWGAPGAYYSDDGGSTWTAATGTVPTWDGTETYQIPNGGFAPLAGKVFGGDAALRSSP